MKIYLVGGAVRDKLLGYPVKEKDWVVIGSTPKQLIENGYKRVGHDFPVFLHPITKEEFSLARTEKKFSPGYCGFTFDFNPYISLEEDLKRRDLTINSIAMDKNGNIIDPYRGQYDIKNKILRHTSLSFIEDPVRILRIARFAARYHHLGFKIAKETKMLLYSMSQSEELKYLTVERIWKEWQKSLTEKNPEIFIKVLRKCGVLQIILPEINNLFGIPNSICNYPKIDSGIHALISLKESSNITSDPIVRFASLVYNIGKIKTPIEHWPNHKLHKIFGKKIIFSLCNRLKIPLIYRKLAILASNFHSEINKIDELCPKKIIDIFKESNAFRNPYLFNKLLLICEADIKSKNKWNMKKNYIFNQYWIYLLNKCLNISTKSIIQHGYKGKDISKILYEKRIDCLQKILKTRKIYEK